MTPSPHRRSLRTRRRIATLSIVLVATTAACGSDGGAPEVGRSEAVEADPAPTADAATGSPGTDATGGGADPSPGFTAAAEAFLASAQYVDGCPLFGDIAAIVAPYGEVTSGSSGPDTTTIGGVEVPEVYCNVGTSGGLASFFLVVVDADAATILDAGLADPNVASGTITPVATSPSAVVGGTVAGACIEGADVSDQCRYVWSNGRVALGYADLSGIDPATAAAVLELAVVDLQLTIV